MTALRGLWSGLSLLASGEEDVGGRPWPVLSSSSTRLLRTMSISTSQLFISGGNPDGEESARIRIYISHSCPPSQQCVPSQFVSQINSPAVSFSCADLLSSSLAFDGSFSFLVASSTSAVATGKQLASFSKNTRVTNNSVAFILSLSVWKYNP